MNNAIKERLGLGKEVEAVVGTRNIGRLIFLKRLRLWRMETVVVTLWTRFLCLNVSSCSKEGGGQSGHSAGFSYAFVSVNK